MGFDCVPAADSSDRRQYRKGKNNRERRAGGPGQPVGDRRRGGRPYGDASAAWDVGGLRHLVGATKKHGMELALDIAFQCSPDHPWVMEHPDWFKIRPDGTIQYAENPPKMYQDIYPLNFESGDWRGLWDALFGVFKFWIDRGVRVFRVDNPHTKALPFWEWCIAEIRKTNRTRSFWRRRLPGRTDVFARERWIHSGIYLLHMAADEDRVAGLFRGDLQPTGDGLLPAERMAEYAGYSAWQLQETDPVKRRRCSAAGILAATLRANWGIYGPAYEICEWRPAKPLRARTLARSTWTARSIRFGSGTARRRTRSRR